MKKPSATAVGMVLLGIVFAYSLWKQVSREADILDPDTVTISFAHVQLESGIREAYDELIEEYEALNPGVRVEQIPVPQKVWRFWMESRLAGEMAPDLMQLINNDPNPIQPYFHPIDKWINEPNPYNAGTDLEGKAWRDTFLLSMQSAPAYWTGLQAYYAVPLTVYTYRVYYNVGLLEELTGSREFPSDFQSFLKLCDHVVATQGNALYPLAGSSFNAPYVMDGLMGSQTQGFHERINRLRDLNYNLGHMRMGYLQGLWTLRDPEILKGLELVSRFGSYFQPGFFFANREDAIFYFLQKRALMVVTGSFEFTSITSQATFDIGIADIPTPEADDPEYGAFSQGIPNERHLPPRSAYALTKQSRNKEQAIDFLQFMTSQEVHQRFVNASGWVPAVQGVEPPVYSKAFYPRQSGPVRGYPIGIGVETVRLWNVNANLLFEENGIETFLEKVEPVYADHILLGSDKEVRQSMNKTATLDARIAMTIIWGEHEQPIGYNARDLDLALWNQTTSERGFYSNEYFRSKYQSEGIPEDVPPAGYVRPADMEGQQ